MSDSAYFVGPLDGPGPGVLLLHSWWGLDGFFKGLADRLADEGFTVLVPDLNFGEVFDDPDRARRHLAQASPDRLARLTLNSTRVLQESAAGSDPQVGVVGFSMGASLGLWASVRLPTVIGAVVAFYGSQTIDFSDSQAAYQLHMADNDDLVTGDEAAFTAATIGLGDRPVEVHHYPDTRHWFFEPNREGYDPAAANLAWERTLGFLRSRL